MQDGVKPGRIAALFQANSFEAGAEVRYSWLALCLRVARICATLFAVAGFVAAAISMLVGFLMVFPEETRSAGFEAFWAGIAVAVASAAEFLVSLGVIEFVYVILDIEQHLRDRTVKRASP